MSRRHLAAAASRVEEPRRPIGPGPAEAAAWVSLYVLLAALPLAVVLVAPGPASRGFWIELGVGLGFVALAMFGLQFALTARFRRVASPFGLDTQLQFHRQAGLVAFVLALAHAAVLLVAQPAFRAFLDPRDSLVRALALWALLGALVLLIGLTLWRKPLGLPYPWWRATHAVLGFMVVFIGLVHVLRVGHYVAVPWMRALWIGMTGAALLLLVDARLVRPLRIRNRPYRVAEVRREGADSWTLALEPVGHGGMAFEAGQFAWVTIGASPFAVDQHPFSFASSAGRPERPEFTIRELGDYTSTIGEVRPGTRAYLEGPYGAFTLSPHAAGAAFVVGGVGITPVMSILRTLAERRDPRPLVLVYANRTTEHALFRDELAALEGVLDLRVVHVLEEPPAGWEGAVGLVDGALLEASVPRGDPGWQYFVCGPEAMMDVAEAWLLGHGVPMRRLSSERFDIA